ncbi:GntR family transcriptional regulator [Nonomuraea sp. NPDC050328]|uniref:GntR family transcriptional regulator n=1 Tax=Nonomuraea sp. NPDC050328 TaxID=3364361 RepID=UPI0037884EBA
MPEPAYVRIAGEYARRIRSGALPPRVQLPSYKEIAQENDVSEIVVRKALELLQSQGLVRSERRRGVFVADRPNLVRVSPERQLESAERSFENESDRGVQVERETRELPAGREIAEALGLSEGDLITHVVTRATEGGRAISISDTYQPAGIVGVSEAAFLEESITDKLPASSHASWLRTTPGDLVKAVNQRFISEDGRVIMISEVSYPRDRYDAFVFRMSLK